MSDVNALSSDLLPEPSSPLSNESDEYNSLPSSSVDSESEAEDGSDAEREWKESLQQLELLLTMVLVPYLGKYFGRRCAYWGECNIALGACSWMGPGVLMRLARGVAQAGLDGWNGSTRWRWS